MNYVYSLSLSLSRAIKFKIKRDTCNVYILNRHKKKPSLWLHVVYYFLHNRHLQPCRDAKGRALKRNRYQLRWIQTRTPTKLKRYLIQKDEIITQACQVECSNVDPKIINKCIGILSWDVQTCSRFSEWPFSELSHIRLQVHCSWENYLNHSWVYWILKLFLLQGLGLIESKLQHIWWPNACIMYLMNPSRFQKWYTCWKKNFPT